MSPTIQPLPRLAVFDLDGVVYRGPQAVPGASRLVAMLRDAGVAVRFATNNSMSTRAEYVSRLAAHGIAADEAEIITSTSATIEHLRVHLPEVRRVLAVGAPGMLIELRAAGFQATPAADAAPPDWFGAPLAERYDAVVAGLDQAIDYRRLGIAAAAIRAGARFIATNADVRYPVPDGFVPGAGSIVAALRATTGVEPLVIGKPQPTMFQAILEAAGVAPSEALVIGDNPDSDIPAARRAGIRSVLVLTGVADARAAAALDGDRRPDWIAEGPSDVAGLLGLPFS
ncbi:MAG TPA: HAD-IIA family hydrolase [candidate division Zixibacteria bacterium]|nr:HAD-IIA family hydrolase [candidate division Zixibacteria bacterium]